MNINYQFLPASLPSCIRPCHYTLSVLALHYRISSNSIHTINLSHRIMRILFEGGYRRGRTLLFSRTWWHRRWRQVMEHKRVWTTRRLVSLFPTARRSFSTSIRGPASSFLASSLGTSPTTWPRFEWAGADTTQVIVRTLFEGGYYSRKYNYSTAMNMHITC